MNHIFISYSHKDSKYVEKLEQKLIEEGFNVWIDHRIDYGDEWLKVIQKYLDECDAFIVVMSKNSFESEMVQNEVTRAREKKKNIYPILLNGENWLIFQAKQYIDARSGLLPLEKFYKRLEKVTSRKKIEIAVQPVSAIQPKVKPKPKISIEPKIAVRVFGVLVIGLIAIFGVLKLVGLFSQNQAPFSEPTFTPTETRAVNPTSTKEITTKTPQSTNTPGATATPELGIGSSWTRPADNMVMMYVPEGEFQMGSKYGKNNQGIEDQKPVHTVYLDAYWIDRTEVTNVMYALCVQAATCDEPGGNYFGDAQYAEYPVEYVSWDDARGYCAWAGSKLPTEAEWEKAARGTDGRTYPWGEEINCDRANYGGCVGSITQVGRYETGKSPYGVYDMGGNVWEWVADWYDSAYYANSPARNPTGPSSGTSRAQRGGAWNDSPYLIESAYRTEGNPSGGGDLLGFRCARSATP